MYTSKFSAFLVHKTAPSFPFAYTVLKKIQKQQTLNPLSQSDGSRNFCLLFFLGRRRNKGKSILVAKPSTRGGGVSVLFQKVSFLFYFDSIFWIVGSLFSVRLSSLPYVCVLCFKLVRSELVGTLVKCGIRALLWFSPYHASRVKIS